MNASSAVPPAAEPEEPARRAARKSPQPGVWRRRAVAACKLGLALALLAWLVGRGDLDASSFARPLRAPHVVVLALVLAALGLCLSGVRWWLLLAAEGLSVDLRTAIQLTFIGHFWNMVIPGAVSGDAVKMFYVGRRVPRSQREASWSTVFADRLIGLAALVSVSVAAATAKLDLFWGRPELRGTYALMLFVLAGFVAGGAVLRLDLGRDWRLTRWLVARLPMQQSLSRVWEALRRLGGHPGRLLLAYGISLVAHLFAVTNACLIGGLFSEAVAALDYYALVPVALFSNAIPLTPGGVGVGESVLGKLFSWAGPAAASPAELTRAGASVMVWLRLLMLSLALAGGLLYALYRSDGPPAADEPSSGEAADPAPSPRASG